jgi:hypothetical protein
MSRGRTGRTKAEAKGKGAISNVMEVGSKKGRTEKEKLKLGMDFEGEDPKYVACRFTRESTRMQVPRSHQQNDWWSVPKFRAPASISLPQRRRSPLRC